MSMKKEANIHNELKEIAPLLASLPKVSHEFSVPDDYFETLPNLVFERINTEDTAPKVVSKGKLISLVNKRWLAAASVVFSFGVAIWLWRDAQLQEVQLADFSQIDTEEMMAYVTHNINDFDEDVLFDGYTTNAIDELFLNVANTPATSKASDLAPTKPAVKNDTFVKIISTEPTDEELEILLEDIDEEDIF